MVKNVNFNYYPILLEADKKQPKWQGEQFTKGIYQLVVPKKELKRSIFSENACYIPGNQGQYWKFTVNLDRNLGAWLKAMEIGNITFDDEVYHIIGRFSKRGTKFYFAPDFETHYDAKPY